MTSERRRSSCFAERARLILAVSALVLAGSTGNLPAQVEEEDIATSLSEYRAMLEEGTTALNSLEFAESIDAFTRLIEAYKSGQIPMITPDAREIVSKAYEGRALAMANLGRNEEASADFEALIRFEPGHSIDLEGTSPKIVSLFTEARKALVGVIQVETDPLGAEVLLDDLLLGPAPISDRNVLAGTHTLKISREGFDPVEEEIQVDAGVRLERQFRLTPNARGIRVATVPRDVKVIVDDEERGTTFGRAGTTYEDVASEMGLALADISEPLLVPNLSPGEHTMVLRKDCYEEVTVGLSIEVDIENNAPTAYKPFVLVPSRGVLKIESDPPGAQVYLDGKLAGAAGLTLEDLCSGPHDLVMEMEGLGRYSGAVEVRKDQTVSVSERLRLSLAAFDLREEIRGGESLGVALEGLERYNVLHKGKGLAADLVQRVRLEMESTQGRGLGERTLEELFRTLKVELVAVAAPAGAIGDRIDFLLYGSLHGKPDRWQISASGVEIFRQTAAALDRDLEVWMPWSGIKLIDVHGERHPVILAVTAGSPASTAGVKAGELVVSMGGSPVQSSADFAAALRKASPGATSVLTVESEGKPREVELFFRATPVMLPARDETILYNKAIADLKQAAAMAGEGVEAGYAWLNLGVALMHFGQWEMAIRDGFRRAHLPDAAGISLGTVRYMTGLCYERLGLAEEASGAFQEAAASATSTLYTHDGPALAPSAKRRAAALGGSS
jgi:tetratricopeptide (TPR) repeat protein